MVIKTKRPVKRKFKTTREEKILKRQITNFNNKIRYTFTNADFSYINSSNKHFVIGDRTIEIDKIFLLSKYFIDLRRYYYKWKIKT